MICLEMTPEDFKITAKRKQEAWQYICLIVAFESVDVI
jgi:hypothetical protein